MNIKPVWKVLIAAVTIFLTICSVITCYFDLDGAVEVRDFSWVQDSAFLSIPQSAGDDGRDFLDGKNDAENGASDVTDGGKDGAAENDEKDGEPERTPASEDPALPHWEPSGDYVAIDPLILVNKEYPAGADFVPQDLVQVAYRASDRSAEWQVMTREAADAFNALAEGALAEGYEIVVTTAYRSYNFQSYLYNSYVEKDGQAAADTYSAQPGKSEHQTGLTADVSSPSVGYRLTREYGETDEGKWLAENCWKYGFILRFPLGKEDITGYTYEPWHIRYVGQDAAREIFEQGVTLEEYLGKAPIAE